MQPLVRGAALREEGFCPDAVAGSSIAALSGVTLGIMLGAIDSGADIYHAPALGAVIGGVGGVAGTLTGRVFEKVFINRNNNYFNVIAGTIGGAAFFSSLCNLTLVEFRDELTSPVIKAILQALFAVGGACIGGGLPLLSKDPHVRARIAAGTVSLGIGTSTSIGLGALATAKLYPEIGISHGMEWGLAGISGLVGYLLPSRPTPDTSSSTQSSGAQEGIQSRD